MLKVLAENNIAVVGINRPTALNALNRSIVDALDRELDELRDNREVRALIFHNSDNFAAGADIGEMAECGVEEARAFAFSSTYNKIAALPFPTIAAIEGYALGGGLELALACDIRLAAEDAKLGFPEVGLGIMPGAGGTIRLPRIVGTALAMELILTGEIIDAGRACEIGLVNRALPTTELFGTAMKMAEKIARRGPVAVKAAKRTILAGVEEPNMLKGIAMEADAWAALFGTRDQKEGMQAFLEKRNPAFRGE